MNDESNMVTKKLNISLKPKQKDELVKLAADENRPVNDQIVEMMQFYKKWKGKVKE